MILGFSEPVPLHETEEEQKQNLYGSYGISRQLAHASMRNRLMIYKNVNFGRGGHHRPFNDAVLPVSGLWRRMKFTLQHQDIRTSITTVTVEHVDLTTPKNTALCHQSGFYRLGTSC
jgi:hypothetical protein